MALSVFKAPPTFNFIKNPIPLGIQEDEADFLQFLYQSEVGGVTSEEYDSDRDEGNQSLVDLRPQLRKFFKDTAYPLPDLTYPGVQVDQANNEICKPFRVNYKSQFNDPVEENALFYDSFCLVRWACLERFSK